MLLLETKKLTKRFGDIAAVDEVSFEVRPGEIYGLLGPNGAGKTTSISLACGLLKPDGGDILVAGNSFWKNPKAARKIMGVVPQDLALYEELSGRENLEFWGSIAGLGRKEARNRAAQLLEALTLTDRGGDAVKKYSGGMKRRINLGCALMHRPRLILLDEPTVGIDPQARMNILEFVRQLVADGVGILYTTHYLEEAETLCDRIGIIDHGKILAEGTLSELRKEVPEQQLFSIEALFDGIDVSRWTEFNEQFRIVQRSETQMLVAASSERDPAECLKQLLALPIRLENVTLKRPSLNETFLHLTGRELRE
ncbi:MAG TPA: ABC transporter ATP-binding protein [Pontiella sp.]|nr:ABC transporter ATP-binding protein [Pontiella sp.]